MSHEDQVPTGEQSWIVLDERGWGTSRPSSASPSRPLAHVPFHHVNDEDEEDEIRQVDRRLGMDRDVREALELAERSLELAGSAEEFSFRRFRTGSEEETHGHSTILKSLRTDSESPDDRYNGRAPPTVKRSIAIATDSEHIAFRNITGVTDSVGESKCPSPAQALAQAESNSDAYIGQKRGIIISSHRPHSEEEDLSSPFWFLGLSSSSNMLPLILSHALTLLAGFYLGFKRASIAPATSQGSTSSVSTVALTN